MKSVIIEPLKGFCPQACQACQDTLARVDAHLCRPEPSREGKLYLWSVERPSWSSTAASMGSIIAVVAAFEIHMDRKAVGTMKPSIILAQIIFLKSLSWLFEFLQQTFTMCVCGVKNNQNL